MRCAPAVVVCAVWLGACSVLVDTSGLSGGKGGGATDGAAGDGSSEDGAADVVGADGAPDAASCKKSGAGCFSDDDCCSKKCGVFPFVLCN